MCQNVNIRSSFPTTFGLVLIYSFIVTGFCFGVKYYFSASQCITVTIVSDFGMTHGPWQVVKVHDSVNTEYCVDSHSQPRRLSSTSILMFSNWHPVVTTFYFQSFSFRPVPLRSLARRLDCG